MNCCTKPPFCIKCHEFSINTFKIENKINIKSTAEIAEFCQSRINDLISQGKNSRKSRHPMPCTQLLKNEAFKKSFREVLNFINN